MLSTLKALVIDDNRVVRAMLTEMLRELGYDVSSAPGARDGLALIQVKPFDILLCDVRLEDDISGLDLVATLGSRRPRNVIFISGDIDPDHVPAGAHYLQKPFTMSALRDVLGR